MGFLGNVSGIDTQSLIDEIIAAEQERIDAVIEEKELQQGIKDVYSDLELEIATFAEAAQLLSASNTYSNTLFDQRNVASSDETVATAVATASAVKGSFDIVVGQLAKPDTIYGTDMGATWTWSDTGDGAANDTFTVNGVTITVDADDTLASIASNINSKTGWGSGGQVFATVIDNQLVLSSATGVDNYINLEDTDGTLLQELGVLSAGTGDTSGGNTTNINNAMAQVAIDGTATIMGVQVTSDTNAFADAMTGVTLSVYKAGSTTLTIETDTEAIQDAIVDFVDGANALISTISSIRAITTDPDEEFGPLYNDSILRNLETDLRAMMTGPVQKFNSASWPSGRQINANAGQGATTIVINGLTSDSDIGNLTVREGDKIRIEGHTTIYEVAANSTNNVVQLKQGLESAVAIGDEVTPYMLVPSVLGIDVDTSNSLDGSLTVDTDILSSYLATADGLSTIQDLFSNRDPNNDINDALNPIWRPLQDGIANRVYEELDRVTKLTSYSHSRSITDQRIPGLESKIEDLDERIARLEEDLIKKQEQLEEDFANMEAAMARAESAAQQLASLAGGDN